jgi:hypothetical protein
MDMSQVVELLLSKLESMSSNTRTDKTKIKQKAKK